MIFFIFMELDSCGHYKLSLHRKELQWGKNVFDPLLIFVRLPRWQRNDQSIILMVGLFINSERQNNNKKIQKKHISNKL